ncbi:hypothetical protein Mgra_00004503 [Meloidogyne graminicola]|uniref:Uncharacterized protein n=1 Tax=Meloidogyne graminicola TaxID=189291 RepID=A0A8S9ZRG1_9BILA|nr:hypothetical protein Mgra_00004503 [Meloidogyne graminicola]
MENNKLFFERIVSLLETFAGRDKAIRTLYCTLSLISTKIQNEEINEKIVAFAKQLSKARLVFRMFSQPSLFLSAIRISENWRNSIDHIETFLNSWSNILYLICGWTEIIGWLSEAKLLKKNSAKFFQLSLHLWVLALLTNIIRCIRQILIKIIYKKHKIFKLIKDDFISLIALTSDFIAAINSFPKGILWAGKLSSSKSCSLFLIASIIVKQLNANNSVNIGLSYLGQLLQSKLILVEKLLINEQLLLLKLHEIQLGMNCQ